MFGGGCRKFTLIYFGVFHFILGRCILNYTRQWWFSKKTIKIVWSSLRFIQMAMQTRMACRICRQPVWDISFLLVTLFWQNLSLFVCRYLTCKLGLATGRILQGFMEPYLLPSVLMATGIRLILSLCSAMHCSYFRYILFAFFRYMPLKSTLVRKIISPKSYEFAHILANQVCS